MSPLEMMVPPEEIPDPEERMRLQTQVFGKTREELTAQPECYMGANYSQMRPLSLRMPGSKVMYFSISFPSGVRTEP